MLISAFGFPNISSWCYSGLLLNVAHPQTHVCTPFCACGETIETDTHRHASRGEHGCWQSHIKGCAIKEMGETPPPPQTRMCALTKCWISVFAAHIVSLLVWKCVCGLTSKLSLKFSLWLSGFCPLSLFYFFPTFSGLFLVSALACQLLGSCFCQCIRQEASVREAG